MAVDWLYSAPNISLKSAPLLLASKLEKHNIQTALLCNNLIAVCLSVCLYSVVCRYLACTQKLTDDPCSLPQNVETKN